MKNKLILLSFIVFFLLMSMINVLAYEGEDESGIYNALNSFGAGTYFLVRNLGLSVPLLLITIGSISIVLIIVYGLVKFIKIMLTGDYQKN